MSLPQFGIEIDKLTRSIESAISGNSFITEIYKLSKADNKFINKKDWLFNWKKEAKDESKIVYKLVIRNDPTVIQGLISLEDKGDHIFMHLIESNRFNQGSKKVYLGIPGNLVAFACKKSFDGGYDGYVSFESKTKLIEHYKKTLNASVIFGNMMAIETKAAKQLVERYFTDNP